MAFFELPRTRGQWRHLAKWSGGTVVAAALCLGSVWAGAWPVAKSVWCMYQSHAEADRVETSRIYERIRTIEEAEKGLAIADDTANRRIDEVLVELREMRKETRQSFEKLTERVDRLADRRLTVREPSKEVQ
jgi:hypothetical protein